jgi:hypothetical protein
MTTYRYNQDQSIKNWYSGSTKRDINQNAEYKRFSEEYFNGQDVRIYFGDTWVDEITALQFSMQENAAPIFGYASHTFDTVAQGSRQIQGSFRINFKESYYLHSITNRLESNLEGLKNVSASKSVPKQNITIDHLTSSIDQNEKFEGLALEFEKSLWGASTMESMQSRANERGSESYFYPESARSGLAKNGLNILVLYGPYTESLNKPESKAGGVSVTAHSISGVYLTGVSQVIDGSGQPIFEEYSFIARDLDENVNMYNAVPYYPFSADSRKDTTDPKVQQGGKPYSRKATYVEW